MLYRCTHLIASFLSLSKDWHSEVLPQHLFGDNQPKFPKNMALAQCTPLHPLFPSPSAANRAPQGVT